MLPDASVAMSMRATRRRKDEILQGPEACAVVVGPTVRWLGVGTGVGEAVGAAGALVVGETEGDAVDGAAVVVARISTTSSSRTTIESVPTSSSSSSMGPPGVVNSYS